MHTQIPAHRHPNHAPYMHHPICKVKKKRMTCEGTQRGTNRDLPRHACGWQLSPFLGRQWLTMAVQHSASNTSWMGTHVSTGARQNFCLKWRWCVHGKWEREGGGGEGTGHAEALGRWQGGVHPPSLRPSVPTPITSRHDGTALVNRVREWQ